MTGHVEQLHFYLLKEESWVVLFCFLLFFFLTRLRLLVAILEEGHAELGEY